MYGSMRLFGIVALCKAIAWGVISSSVTMISAAAQPSSGAERSRSLASFRGAPSRTFANSASRSQSAPLPSFDDFPHRLVPATGVFEGWCGNKDRYLIWDAPGDSSRLFDPDSDDAETKITMAGHGQCDPDGDNIVFVDHPPGAITKFDVGRRSTETLAFYQKLQKFGPENLSISPDLKSVVFDPESVRFDERSGEPHIKLLPLPGGAQWKSDGSMLFHGSNNDIDSISVVDTRIDETFRGKLPIGFNFMNGVFLDSGRELMVFMRPRSNLPASWPPGTLFRCSIASFKCRPIVASVDDISMNEHGLIGAVTMIYNNPKHRYDSESFRVPNKYALTVMNADGRVLIKQELPGYSKRNGRANVLADVKLYVSPSSRRVILEWKEAEFNQKCETEQGRCAMREIVELPMPH